VRHPPQNMFRTALWFFVAGLLVAIMLETLWRMVGYYSPSGYVLERIARFLWPSSVFKMALDGGRNSWTQASFIYSLSLVANGLLYGLFGLLISFAKNLLARQR
jgi:hypothetical protein